MRRHLAIGSDQRIDPGPDDRTPGSARGIDELVLLANVMNTQSLARINYLTVGFVGQQIPVRTAG